MTKPNHWDLLSLEDQASYAALQQELSAPGRKSRRHHSLENFSELLNTIKRFVIHNDGNDWKRGLVCGICWLDATVAVNTRQLRLLVSKSKSSINGSFQLLGFNFVLSGGDCAATIVRYFPILKDNFTELRQWTLRYTVQPSQFASPAPEAAAVSESAGVGFDLESAAEWLRNSIEPFRETDGFKLAVFDDPASFCPSFGERKWDECDLDFLNQPKESEIADLD
jgi:hypothetical protein